MTAKTKVFGNDYLTLKFNMENKKNLSVQLEVGDGRPISWFTEISALNIPSLNPLTFS